MILRAAIILFFAFTLSFQAKGQVYSFECVCANITAPNCDICNTNIQSRYFSGLYIKKNGVGFKWIDAPYIVKWQGYTAVISEIIPNPETISISIAGTSYGTLDSFKMAIDCRCGIPTDSPLFYPSDSINVGAVYHGDTLTIVGRNLAQVTFDSLLNKYVINVDSIAGGGGSGTVTIVAATAPAAGFDIAGSPITTSGTFVFTLDNDLAAVEG